MLKRFFHLNLNCKNFERSLAFYQMLGFKVVRDVGEGGGKVFERGFHIPNNNARAAMLALSEYHAGVARIAIETDDIQAEYARLKTQGIEFMSEPQRLRRPDRTIWFTVFKDPDGNFLELYQWSLTAPSP
jgi:catechol 2,3-dioxygenase-like lactoylglutathione lyase family enzyme